MRVYKCEKIFPVMLAVILLTMLIGCSSSGPNPEELIAKAQVAINEVESYRIEMTTIVTENGKTTQSSYQGEFVSPDRLHMIKIDEDGNEASIRIGQTEYNQNANSNNWEVRQWPESFPFYNPAVTLVKELDSLVGLVRMSDEDINSVDCFHYKGSIDTDAQVDEAIAKLDPSKPGYEERIKLLELSRRPQQFTLEFWIDKEDHLLRQLKQYQDMVFIEDIGEDTKREEHINAVIAYRFFDFNQSIQIKAPIT